MTACETCDGDGLIVIGWDAEAYEDIEGPCPDCAKGRLRLRVEAEAIRQKLRRRDVK